MQYVYFAQETIRDWEIVRQRCSEIPSLELLINSLALRAIPQVEGGKHGNLDEVVEHRSHEGAKDGYQNPAIEEWLEIERRNACRRYDEDDDTVDTNRNKELPTRRRVPEKLALANREQRPHAEVEQHHEGERLDALEAKSIGNQGGRVEDRGRRSKVGKPQENESNADAGKYDTNDTANRHQAQYEPPIGEKIMKSGPPYRSREKKRALLRMLGRLRIVASNRDGYEVDQEEQNDHLCGIDNKPASDKVHDHDEAD